MAPEETDEKLEFLSQIISLQAAKIRRLEDRLKKIENILPDYGSFEDQPNVSDDEKDAKDDDDENKKDDGKLHAQRFSFSR